MITDDEFEAICCEIECSSSGLRTIIAKSNVSTCVDTFYRYMHKNGTASERYARAKQIQGERIADDILDIADNSTNDFMATETGQKPDTENIQRSRLRVDSRKWLLSKLLPKKYGEKIDVDQTNRFPDGININFTHSKKVEVDEDDLETVEKNFSSVDS